MALVSKTIPALYNGVSQQAPELRLETQGELQENALSSLVTGLSKRPPTEWLATLAGSASLDSFIHSINRDVQERYIVIINADPEDPVQVFTLTGEKCTVLYGSDSAKEYLTYREDGTLVHPRKDLRAVTVADHTILVNSTRRVKLREATDDVQPPTALVFVKRGIAACDYNVQIKVDDEVVADVTYTSQGGDKPDTFKTNHVAQELYEKLTDALGEDWEVRVFGSSLTIRRQDGGDFSIKTTDSYGNDALKGIKGSVQRFTDLPPEAEDGMVLKVEGDADSSFDNFYVKFRDNEEGSGVWQETVKPGLQNEFDPCTMPHRLIRSGYNEFTLLQIEWEPRLVGDEHSAPEPSFVGGTINDVFFYKNRLGMLSGENVFLSRAGDFFNLWPSTATDVLDNDPIDVAVSTTSVAILRYAVPFVHNLILFSDQHQFSLSAGGSILAPRTVAIDPATQFEISPACRPVGSGPNLYFVVPNGPYSTIREYFVQPNTQVNDAADVTAHVPRYLPANIHLLDVSTARDMLFALSSDDPKTLYVYKYYWNGEEKVQSSWSKWTFDDEILSFTVIDDLLFLVMKKDGDHTLCRINLEMVESPGLDFRVHLDKQVRLNGTYDAATERTYWVLPYNDTSDTFTVVRGDNGFEVQNVTKDGNTLSALGDLSNIPCFIGKPYTMRYRFSRWYLKDSQGVAITQGRLQIRTCTLTYSNTGYLALEVRPALRQDPLVRTMTGVTIGVSRLGKPSIVSGEKRFLVMSNNDADIDIVNDTYLPSSVHSAGFEGFWTTRSRTL